MIFYFFFFQAEDGIRDVAVTGVQTCALPISTRYFLFVVFGLIVVRYKERRGRQLVAVSCNNHLRSADDGRHGVFGKDLASFVKYNHIKKTFSPVQQLADRQRTGHPARAERRYHVWCFDEKLAQWQQTAHFLRLTPDQIFLVRMCVHRRNCTFGVGSLYASRSQFHPHLIQGIRISDELIVCSTAETSYFGIGEASGIQAGCPPSVIEHLRPEFGKLRSRANL